MLSECSRAIDRIEEVEASEVVNAARRRHHRHGPASSSIASASRAFASPIPGRRPGVRRPRPRDRSRAIARHRRRERCRQDDAREAVVPALRPERRADHRRRRRPARARPRVRGIAGWPPSSRTSCSSSCRPTTTSRTAHSVTATTSRPCARAAELAGAARRRRTAARRVATPSEPRVQPTARSSRAASGSGSRWPERCSRCVRAPASSILDEPTAALDVRGEAEVYERFLDLTRGVTTLVISHRFSTVRRADRIVVVDAGRVIEDGTHDELMAAGGRYASMYWLQASRFDPDGAGMRSALRAIRPHGHDPWRADAAAVGRAPSSPRAGNTWCCRSAPSGSQVMTNGIVGGERIRGGRGRGARRRCERR